jgi:glutamate-ammonia-ligase adenylyltransferase
MPHLSDLEIELTLLPIELRELFCHSYRQWNDQITALTLDFNLPAEVRKSLIKVWCSSQFVVESCLRRPQLLMQLIESGDLTGRYGSQAYAEKLAGCRFGTEAELMAELRQFRRREMVRIAWRDIAGWAELSETLTDLSYLADACIQIALDFLYRQACEKRGTPLLANGNAQQIVVLGMGKLGAYELNYSSDIDLIFAYAEDGVLTDRKATTYGEFFTRLCQSLVKVLDEITVDGFVFRTDIRLRPFGDSGAVIMTFDGMENYYLTQAREWERYAMIKARQVAGDFEAGAQLMAMLRSFVYRRYLDYGAFEELRALKQQITQELKRKDRMENIKLGPGGIREIEFIGQAFQLIRGGAEKSLQLRGILEVLRLLGEMSLLTESDARQLIHSYRFLRRVENHIQQYQDKQTHDLPTDPATQQILAYSLDYPDWRQFKAELNQVRAQVHAVFDQVFSLSKQETIDQKSRTIWLCATDNAELLANLADLGFRQAEDVLATIKGFKNSVAIRRLTVKGAGVLDRLMPQLLEALPQVANPYEALKRLLTLFEAVAGRNVYLALLAENPDALAKLIRLASASVWICAYLAQYPILFDEFLDHRSLFEPLKKQGLDAQLDALLAPIDSQDIESIMTKLREFKQLNVLRVAAADIMGAIPLMVVSDYLTYIAESIVGTALDCAWRLVAQKHGCPPGADLSAMNFAVIGFGKFGGIELGYGSDLDLVFLSDYSDGHALTQGDRPITSTQFYGRLGQKLRHMLDTRLLSGALYEVDMRLRPSGDSGLLVAPINSYELYYRTQAWTWEQQALVRARFIAGDPRLQQQFETIRQRILCLPRETVLLKQEVREMREKMRAALASRAADKFDLKQGAGGIADIEFIVQYGVLAQAANHPALTRYTDNMRLLETLSAQGLIAPDQAELLKQAYCRYRDYGHKQVLQGDNALIGEAEVANMRQQVEQIWHQVLD